MKKKLLAMLLAAVLAVTLLPGTAFAADAPASGTCGKNMTWSYGDGVLTINGTGAMDSYSPPFSFAPWVDWIEDIQTVIISDGVNYIGINAFSNCTSLTSVTIGSGVINIHNFAFDNCDSLTDVYYGGTESQWKQIFIESWGNDPLNNATIHCTDGDNKPDEPTTPGTDSDFVIEDGVLMEYTGEGGNVVIPSSVTHTGFGAFANCTSLTSVTIPNSVTSIAQFTFSGCTSLTSVTIPASVTFIGFGAFGNCGNLTVYYGGSDAQWGGIRCSNPYVGEGSFLFSEGGQELAGLNNVTVHYNSAGPDTAQPETPKITFTDIGEDSWCRDAVSWAVEKGITNGYPGNIFGEGYKCTNIQILTFLYRAVRGEGEASGDDMEKAVSWARERGMIGDGFERDANCTRSDAVMFIWQVKGSPAPANSSSFTDVPAGTAYADAVSWAAENGVANGYGSSFGPKDTCTRGQIVTFLYRALAD